MLYNCSIICYKTLCGNFVVLYSLQKVHLIPGYAWTRQKWGGDVTVPRYPRVVPGADACLCVKEVHLTLYCCSLLCF